MIIIQKNPSRDIMTYKKDINLKKWLGGFYFCSVIFGGVGVMSIVAASLPPYETGLLVFKISGGLIFLFFGYRFIIKAVRTYRMRVQAFSKGVLMKGEVVSQGRTFVSWKSGKDYTLIIQVTLESGKVLEKKIRSPHPDLHSLHPMRSEIDMLVDVESGSMFIPSEVGIEASFQ